MPEPVRNGKNGIYKLLGLLIPVITIVFWAGYSYSVQQAHAGDIEELNTNYIKLAKIVQQIPVIERDISHIHSSQRKAEATQESMRREQVIMIKALSRIEAKL